MLVRSTHFPHPRVRLPLLDLRRDSGVIRPVRTSARITAFPGARKRCTPVPCWPDQARAATECLPRPISLERTRRNVCQATNALEFTHRGPQSDSVTLAQTPCGRICRTNEHVGPVSAGQHILLSKNHGVELLPASRREIEHRFRQFRRQGKRREDSAAIRRGAFSTGAKHRATILHPISLTLQPSDATIYWDNALHFVPDLLCMIKMNQAALFRADHTLSYQHRNLPFRFSFADPWPRNFRRKADATLRICNGSAARLLVPSLARQQKNGFSGFGKHGAIEKDILMHSATDAGKAFAHAFRLRQGFKEIPALNIKHVQPTLKRPLHHFRRCKARLLRNRKSPEF